MEITTLKNQLNIYQVAERLDIQINKYHKSKCPFHDDKRPSLQFSQDKQIATCFSGNCSAGSMDVINLTEKKLNLSTHEAIKWLQQEFTLEDQKPVPPKEEVNYAKLFRTFEGNLKKSSKGKGYLESRGINYEGLEVGYNATGWDKMKYCVIFPLKNQKGEVVSLYGRSINGGHYYSGNRQGLYPSYPSPETEILILTESIIDAATLKQYTDCEILALYGTNGLTDEHLAAMKGLTKLKEAILWLDGDEAGKAASVKYGEQLSLELGIKVSQVETPEGEDINSLAVNHPGQEKELLEHLIKDRTSFFLSSEVKSNGQQPKAKLNTTNPELLNYQNCVLNFTILGGIKITGLDRLRVTLKIEHQSQNHLLPLRHNLDLYNNGQVEQLTQKVAEQMEVTTQESVTAIAQLINELESYRERRLEAMKPKKETKPQLSIKATQEAQAVLKSPKLMEQTMKLITQSGIVGEERNAFIAYLTYTSRKREAPLHLMCLGASGTGKTYLQEKVGDLMPDEDKLEITTLSENAFYYFGREELKHKLILIEDLDGAEAVLYPLRELQSKRKISKTVTLKDNKGNLKTMTLIVEGPVSVSGCTTREKIYEDNANRCILVYIDTSSEQDKKIMQYQQQVSAGTINKDQEAAARERLKNMQRLLKPIQIRNPYAAQIQLPESVFKPRRTMMLLLSFIETITYYHQHQRRQKDGYIETTPEDVEWGFRLLKEVLFAKSDELSGACRSFFERLKNQKGNGSFVGQEIRKEMRLAPSTMKRYLFELSRYGYIKIVGGSKYRGFEYQVIDSREYEKLKDNIDNQLDTILKKIKAPAAGGSVAQ